MSRAMIFNQEKCQKRAVDTIVSQSSTIHLTNVTMGVLNTNLLTFSFDLDTSPIKEMESGTSRIYDTWSWNLTNSPNIANKAVEKIKIEAIKTNKPINLVFSGIVTGYYSNHNIHTDGFLYGDEDIEIIFSGPIGSTCTLDENEDTVSFGIFPFNKTTIKSSGYLNIIFSGFLSFINRTSPSN